MDPDAPVPIGDGDRSTWSNIDWRTAGAPLVRLSNGNLTISHSTIEPFADVPHDVRGLFEEGAGPYRLMGNPPAASAS